MSKTVGIIAEYNPFHTGHQYQIDCLHKMGYKNIAVAMSGSCVQRGQFALLSKFDRGKMALNGGVNLVCEIPFPYSSLSAEGFAKAGVSVLKNIGVDALCFGSESGDLATLTKVANFLLTAEYSNLLKTFLEEKMPFAAARQKAILKKFYISPNIISASNDILAVEYIKQALILNWDIEFIPIERKGAFYNDTAPKNGFASASYVRKCVGEFKFEQALEFIPNGCKNLFAKNTDRGNYFVPDICFEKAVLYKLRQLKSHDFSKIPDCNKELSFAFEKVAAQGAGLQSLYNLLPTKQYTKSRLDRIILFALLNCTDFPKDIPYIRLLAMDKTGEEIVKKASETSLLPISHSPKMLQKQNQNCKKISELEALATDTQSVFRKISDMGALDYTTRIYKK